MEANHTIQGVTMSKKLLAVLAAAFCATGAFAHDGYSHYYRSNDCPPGLAMKHNGCLPPGHAMRMSHEERLAQNQRLHDIRVAQNRRFHDMRVADNHRLHDLRVAENRRMHDMRVAENRRIHDLRVAENQRMHQRMVARYEHRNYVSASDWRAHRRMERLQHRQHPEVALNR